MILNFLNAEMCELIAIMLNFYVLESLLGTVSIEIWPKNLCETFPLHAYIFIFVFAICVYVHHTVIGGACVFVCFSLHISM